LLMLALLVLTLPSLLPSVTPLLSLLTPAPPFTALLVVLRLAVVSLHCGRGRRRDGASTAPVVRPCFRGTPSGRSR